jgi:hypothetical protein
MNVQVRRTKAWDQDGAPVVWGFFNTPTKLKAIFNEVSKLTESKFTKEHSGKFYYNGVGGFWFTYDKKSVDLAKKKIEETYDDIRINVNWNVF